MRRGLIEQVNLLGSLIQTLPSALIIGKRSFEVISEKPERAAKFVLRAYTTVGTPLSTCRLQGAIWRPLCREHRRLGLLSYAGRGRRATEPIFGPHQSMHGLAPSQWLRRASLPPRDRLSSLQHAVWAVEADQICQICSVIPRNRFPRDYFHMGEGHRRIFGRFTAPPQLSAATTPS